MTGGEGSKAKTSKQHSGRSKQSQVEGVQIEKVEEVNEPYEEKGNEDVQQLVEEKSLHEPIMKTLCCSNPNSNVRAEFNICNDLNVDKTFYDIRSSPSSIQSYSVEKYEGEHRFSLDFNSYDYTLDEWTRNDVWCTTYEAYGVMRPSHKCRIIIMAMITAVYELHQKPNCFHGALNHLDNYAIRHVTEGKVEVTLLYKIWNNYDNPKSVKEGIVKDMSSLYSIIFETILEKKENYMKFPEDLKDLHDMMKAASHKNWKFIVTHPSLWHWRSRFNYFEEAWTKYIYGDCQTCQDYVDAIKKVGCAQNWDKLIPTGTPFDKMFNAGNGYKDDIALLNYARDFFHHVNDKKKDGSKLYLDSPEEENLYSEDQYVEKCFTDIFPMLLVELYQELL